MVDQIEKLKMGCDITFGSPGRIMESGHLKINKIKKTILDIGIEASKTEIYKKFNEILKNFINFFKWCSFYKK